MLFRSDRWQNRVVDDAAQIMGSAVRVTQADPVWMRVIATGVYGASRQWTESKAMAESLKPAKMWLCERELVRLWLR